MYNSNLLKKTNSSVSTKIIMHKIITLTSDLGYKDFFVGAIKGKIRAQQIEQEIIDISHGIGFYNVDEAGFIIAAAYNQFPKGTIHILSVNCEITPLVKPILVVFEGHYFLTADNGVLSFLLKNSAEFKIFQLPEDDFTESIDVFIKAAKLLTLGVNLEEIGTPTDTWVQLAGLNLAISTDKSTIRGNVIYEDHFGNAITNISRSLFEEIQDGRNFDICVKNKKIKKINKYFSDFNISEAISINDKVGDLLAIFNELNYLQISVFHSNPYGPGSPRTLIGLEHRDSITIKFYDKPTEILI